MAERGGTEAERANARQLLDMLAAKHPWLDSFAETYEKAQAGAGRSAWEGLDPEDWTNISPDQIVEIYRAIRQAKPPKDAPVGEKLAWRALDWIAGKLEGMGPEGIAEALGLGEEEEERRGSGKRNKHGPGKRNKRSKPQHPAKVKAWMEWEGLEGDFDVDKETDEDLLELVVCFPVELWEQIIEEGKED